MHAHKITYVHDETQALLHMQFLLHVHTNMCTHMIVEKLTVKN